jgi:LacI family transcriptional regulator
MDSSSQRPITIREIADLTGLSTATVSMALRDSPKISAPVRKIVREAAKKAGYRPNPLLAAHWQAVRARRPSCYQSTIAILNDQEQVSSWAGSPWGGEILRAFDARAKELGYLTEEFHVGKFSDDDRRESLVRVSKVMRARCISAYLIIYCGHPRIFLDCQKSFSEFAGVFVNAQFNIAVPGAKTSRAHLPFHRVNPDRYANMVLLLEKLRDFGYQRPGFWPSHWMEGITAGEAAAAFDFWIRLLPAANRLPIAVKEWQLDLPIASHRPAFLRWLTRAKPDVVLCENFEVRTWITESGLRIPKDIGLAHLSLGPLEAGWSGINPHRERIASAAADLLTAHLQRNERGTPPFPKEISIDGSWVSGKTTRMQTASPSSAS